MIERVETNDCEIRINARSKGDYGFIRIGGMERTPKEEYRLCEEIVSNIKRHVDDIGWTHIQQKKVFETEDGEQYDTLYEALEALYDENGSLPNYQIRYVRPSDNGTGTRRTLHDFRDVITEAYVNPFEFEILKGSTPLTEEQQAFLGRIIDAALDEKMVKEGQDHE